MTADEQARAAEPCHGALLIPVHLAAQFNQEARAASPAEACGILGGCDGQVVCYMSIPNVAEDITRYLMEPRALYAALRDLECAGQNALAFVHSHTHTPAYPSATDIACALYPDVLYLIVSLCGDVPEYRAFSIVEDQVSEVGVHFV